MTPSSFAGPSGTAAREMAYGASRAATGSERRSAAPRGPPSRRRRRPRHGAEPDEPAGTAGSGRRCRRRRRTSPRRRRRCRGSPPAGLGRVRGSSVMVMSSVGHGTRVGGRGARSVFGGRGRDGGEGRAGARHEGEGGHGDGERAKSRDGVGVRAEEAWSERGHGCPKGGGGATRRCSSGGTRRWVPRLPGMRDPQVDRRYGRGPRRRRQGLHRRGRRRVHPWWGTGSGRDRDVDLEPPPGRTARQGLGGARAMPLRQGRRDRTTRHPARGEVRDQGWSRTVASGAGRGSRAGVVSGSRCTASTTAPGGWGHPDEVHAQLEGGARHLARQPERQGQGEVAGGGHGRHRE